MVALALPSPSPPQMVAVSGARGSGRTTLLDLLDPASQGVASYLLQLVAQLGGVPVVVSLASGTERVGGHVATVDIEPLSTDEVRVLVEDLIQDPVPYRVADGLRGGTGGNLLAIVEAWDG